jgi:RNA polymerase sigma-70 factor (ECF subfamily)
LDESLAITSLRAGNLDAFGGIVDLYQPQIMRYLYRLTGDVELAKDLTQDTFVQAFESIPKMDQNSQLQLKPWLFRVATNKAMQYYHRKKIIPFIHLGYNRDINTSDNGDPSREVIERLSVEAVLCRIAVQQRTCLILHFVEGFKYREIAKTLGISEDAVRMRIMRGQQAFRKIYSGGDTK